MNYIERALGGAMDELGMAHGGLYYRTRGDGVIDHKGDPIIEPEASKAAAKAMLKINAAKESIIEAMQLIDAYDMKFS